MRGSIRSRLHNLLASARVLSTLDAEAREALRAAAEHFADENVRARRAPTIDPTAKISLLTSLRFTDRLEIGPRVNLAPYCAVWGGWDQSWTRLEADAHVGTGAAIVAGNHAWKEPGSIYEIGMDEADVTIGQGASITANAVVIGCSVGRYALVGTNSVVTRDVPDYAIVAGIPARVVGERPPVTA